MISPGKNIVYVNPHAAAGLWNKNSLDTRIISVKSLQEMELEEYGRQS
jgi:hypothetical protein